MSIWNRRKGLIRMPDELKSSNKTCMGGGPPLVGTWAAIFANLRSAIGCAKFCKAGTHLHQAAATARWTTLRIKSTAWCCMGSSANF